MVVFDFIKQNSELLYKLQLSGVKDLNTALDYQAIYSVYLNFENIKSKMQRIESTARSCKVYTTTVRTAIKFMENKI